MVLGTASHVGKSLITAALCRIFSNQSIDVSPFKSQNMSLNSAATPEGLEIGRAQALQAEAARIPASVHMNPILLKPTGNMTSQVIVQGRIHGHFTAQNYHQRRTAELFPYVRNSYKKLAKRHALLILEGAGSPAEINLKRSDIANLKIARMAHARCILVGDIDRGGVFASLLGTLELLTPRERSLIGGFLINKFRGDQSLLTPGIRTIERRLRIPCLGVIPWFPNLTLDEEDSLGLPQIVDSAWPTPIGTDRPLRIAVPALPSLSNFTDLDPLRAEPAIDLRLIRTPAALAGADLILLPGSKQTAADLHWLRQTGMAAVILLHAQTSLLIGICGGMQMLGRSIEDPHAIESSTTTQGLGLLPFKTVMQPAKTTQTATGTLIPTELFSRPIHTLPVSGYEIHIGATQYEPNAHPLAQLPSGPDGCISPDSRIVATYLHGIFEDDAFRHAVLVNARSFHNLAPAQTLNNWKAQRESALNAFAQHVAQSVDLPTLFRWANQPYHPS